MWPSLSPLPTPLDFAMREELAQGALLHGTASRNLIAASPPDPPTWDILTLRSTGTLSSPPSLSLLPLCLLSLSRRAFTDRTVGRLDSHFAAAEQ